MNPGIPMPASIISRAVAPLFDIGPYHLTALVNLMGPVARVAGLAQMTFPERIATSEALKGQVLPVEVNTHVAGTLEFESGAIVSVIMSFDVWGSSTALYRDSRREGFAERARSQPI